MRFSSSHCGWERDSAYQFSTWVFKCRAARVATRLEAVPRSSTFATGVSAIMVELCSALLQQARLRVKRSLGWNGVHCSGLQLTIVSLHRIHAGKNVAG